METLEENKQRHIDYIIEVTKVCKLSMYDNIPRLQKQLNNMSYEQVTEISETCEDIYLTHLGNEKVDKFLKEANELGLEEAKKKWGIDLAVETSKALAYKKSQKEPITPDIVKPT